MINVWSASGGTTGRLITSLTLHNVFFFFFFFFFFHFFHFFHFFFFFFLSSHPSPPQKKNAITAISDGVMAGTPVVASASIDFSLYIWNASPHSRAPLQHFKTAHQGKNKK